MTTSTFNHNLSRSHFESPTVHCDLYGPVCHTTVASKSNRFNQSPCFIYLLLFPPVLMLSLGLYCPQSTTTVPVKSDWLRFYSKHSDQQQETWPQIPAGKLPDGVKTASKLKSLCCEDVPWYDAFEWKKKCYTSVVLVRSGKPFLLIGLCAREERETAVLWPNPCEQ